MNITDISDALGISRQTVSTVLGTDGYTKRLMRFAMQFKKEEFAHIDEKAEKEELLRIADGEGEQYIDTAEAAEILGCKPESLITMRYRKSGPAFIKTEGRSSIKYKLDDVLKWKEAKGKGKL